MHATKSRLVLVLFMIAGENGASSLNQSLSSIVVKMKRIPSFFPQNFVFHGLIANKRTARMKNLLM